LKCPSDIHAESSIYWKYSNGYPCVYAVSMSHGCPFEYFSAMGFSFGVDITMDIAWILQPRSKAYHAAWKLIFRHPYGQDLSMVGLPVRGYPRGYL